MSKTIADIFKTGELAVYPAHGVGMILGVETREGAGGGAGTEKKLLQKKDSRHKTHHNGPHRYGRHCRSPEDSKKIDGPQDIRHIEGPLRGLPRQPDLEPEIQGVHRQDKERLRNGSSKSAARPLSP